MTTYEFAMLNIQTAMDLCDVKLLALKTRKRQLWDTARNMKHYPNDTGTLAAASWWADWCPEQDPQLTSFGPPRANRLRSGPSVSAEGRHANNGAAW